MTTPYGEYEAPEGVEVPARQPANCPYCGYSGAFGGLDQTRSGKWYRHHCPDCGLKFATHTPENVEVDNVE